MIQLQAGKISKSAGWIFTFLMVSFDEGVLNFHVTLVTTLSLHS